MSIFQPSVLKSHIALLDHKAVDKAYKQFAKYFLDPTIQDNIRVAKEEQNQATFLNELFVKVFNYTLFPNKNHNLITEQKNETNSRKADGAILKGDAVTAVIELKGTKTKDLESIRKQAFDYKNFNTGCNYVITSNFEKLRFYIDDASNFEEFDLFSLSRKRFELLYLCINKEQLLQHTPKFIKEESLVEEEKITKSFYKDYSLFKRELWKDLAKNNVKSLKQLAEQHRSVEKELADGPATEADDELNRLEKNVKRTLFKKSQKLIDRFLFIFFAEDRGLLQPNYTLKSIEEWETVRKLGVEETLYDRFKKHFNYLDQGRKKGDGISEIFAYNGGLFKPDTILDNIVINDELLLKHTKKIAAYDFESQVDVNILGHIFENSLNEIESVNAEIDGADFDKQTSKRKKDGVFYTPKYITKYIVDNTVGKLCEEKKTELGFAESEYYRGRKNRNKSTLENLVKILDDYREWLLQLTICDPACGSGAFLNQALDFLISEHNYIDELKSKLLGGSIALSDIENTILENNIYGVDLNEESVEIAKLSLWLRTAQPRRKLNDLSSNIKCGNSLIDVKAVAGDKAFKWEEEFAQVFAKGGFDVVIGNPPWGAKLGKSAENNLLKRYPEVPSKLKDSYMFFMLSCLEIIKDNAYYGLIVPNTWLLINSTSDFRAKLLSYDIKEIIDHGDAVFQDAIVESASLFLRKKHSNEGTVIVKKFQKGELRIDQVLSKKYWVNDELHRIVIELTEFDYSLIKKMEEVSNRFDYSSEIIFGIKPYQVGHGKPSQTREMVNARIYHSTIKLGSLWKPLVTGTDVNRYSCSFNDDLFIKYGEWLMYSSNQDKIESEKILLRRTSSDLRAVVEYKRLYPQNSLFVITSQKNIHFLCALLNSKLFDRIYKSKCPQVGKVFAEVKPSIIKSLPIVNISSDQEKKFVKFVEFNQANSKIQSDIIENILKMISGNYSLVKLSKKLQNWHELDFGDFIKELNKAIKAENRRRKKEAVNEDYQEIPTLTKKDEYEWMELFTEKKKEVQELQSQIHQTEKEIDQMVYELYGLSDEEIAIVENS